MGQRALEREALLVLQEAAHHITEEDEFAVRELIEGGEFGVAVETLCEQIVASEAVVSRKLHKHLKKLCRQMELDDSYWENIEYGTAVAE